MNWVVWHVLSHSSCLKLSRNAGGIEIRWMDAENDMKMTKNQENGQENGSFVSFEWRRRCASKFIQLVLFIVKWCEALFLIVVMLFFWLLWRKHVLVISTEMCAATVRFAMTENVLTSI